MQVGVNRFRVGDKVIMPEHHPFGGAGGARRVNNLGYIGAVQRLLSKDRPVRGIIVCETATTGLKYADLEVLIKEYLVQFSFTDADLQVEE